MTEVPDYPPSEFSLDARPAFSFLETLVEDAYLKFKDKPFIEDVKNGVRAYNTFDAAQEVIENSNVDSLTLFTIFAAQTIMKPSVIEFIEGRLEKHKNWRDFADSIMQAIISGEMIDKYPEVEGGEETRMNAVNNIKNNKQKPTTT